ncbi:murein hydrolase activator EnvC family protein [Qipengyuania marisflavi]|uniref:Metalloendopeptidase n=1 Tax=Qipengyuania marisflavi TaxID=2486356 RepID=A0A5S3P551_9SPHN|nr:peptidoglycan DD-metalloendopeptidase family protein [Qipengyuania marisflavi]TMM48162.1 metalloendopeptidase [Qipengyuania marisflavi]
MIRRALAILVLTGGLVAVPALIGPLTAQDTRFSTSAEASKALDIARQQQRNARARSERLEQRAAGALQAADKASAQAAALAARVQQAEAAATAAEAQLALVTAQRRTLDRKLAARREPLVRLTGALQNMARRPMTLTMFQPGSLQDLVYTRAVLGSTVPLVRARTASLRGDLERARTLQGEARTAYADGREAEATLKGRRRDLATLAEKERLVARRVSGDASRENRRAQALAEQTRDLDALVGQLEQAGTLRTRLAALPGPIPRPANPGAVTAPPPPSPSPTSTQPPADYQLPVAGRLVGGFGEAASGSGARRPGIALIPRSGAQVVAPAAGRVAFAGPYRGYGRIAIVEHAGGWTSLVTGLASLDVAVGQRVAAGSPLGLAARSDPEITLELRRDGAPINPLDHAD